MNAPTIDTAHLFPILHAKLVDLLRALEEPEWEMPTIAGMWRVKDVAAHLLDTQQRLVSRIRGESAPPPPPIRSNADLVAFIDRLNADGISRYRGLDPSELIALMEEGAPLFADHYRSADPWAEAPFGVSWAGEGTSANWFHTAREFTERWHHQQQIRFATAKPGIMTRELYHPVLDCFIRALPFAYRDHASADDTHVRFNVAGDCGGTWYLFHHGHGSLASADTAPGGSGSTRSPWRLIASPVGKQVAETTIPQEMAWRLFTKGIRRDEARRQLRVNGDAELGYHLLEAIAIVG